MLSFIYFVFCVYYKSFMQFFQVYFANVCSFFMVYAKVDADLNIEIFLASFLLHCVYCVYSKYNMFYIWLCPVSGYALGFVTGSGYPPHCTIKKHPAILARCIYYSYMLFIRPNLPHLAPIFYSLIFYHSTAFRLSVGFSRTHNHIPNRSHPLKLSFYALFCFSNSCF